MKATKFSAIAMIALGSLMALAPMTRAEDTKDDENAKPKAQRQRVARPLDRANRQIEELKLTDEQKPKFEALMKEFREKQQEIRENVDLSQEERVAKVREMRADIAAKAKEILNAEQFEKWEKTLRPGIRARAARGAGEKAPGDKPSEKPPGEKPTEEK
ncbi:MAG: hypothetical protein L0Z50_33415 [Verrucomicrobiales bacterium]|nr:hypothetical protein [Verrucomicrobiales bacterium]